MDKTDMTQKNIKLEWKVHTMGLLKEMVENNPHAGILFQPVNIFKDLLAKVATRATELNDTELNKLMLRLSLYGVSDPDDPAFDPDAVKKYLEREN